MCLSILSVTTFFLAVSSVRSIFLTKTGCCSYLKFTPRELGIVTSMVSFQKLWTIRREFCGSVNQRWGSAFSRFQIPESSEDDLFAVLNNVSLSYVFLCFLSVNFFYVSDESYPSDHPLTSCLGQLVHDFLISSFAGKISSPRALVSSQCCFVYISTSDSLFFRIST